VRRSGPVVRSVVNPKVDGMAEAVAAAMYRCGLNKYGCDYPKVDGMAETVAAMYRCDLDKYGCD
jgi:hypothetical protein